MTGGLVFGPPAWMPERIETTFEPAHAPPTPPTSPVPLASPMPLAPAPSATGTAAADPITPEPVAAAKAAAAPPKDPPRGRDLLLDGLVGVLDRIGLARTSNVVPGLSDQLRDLRQRTGKSHGAVRGLILNLLPTQPEFILGPALTHLALEDLLKGLLTLKAALDPRRTVIVVDAHERHTRKLWKQAIREARRAGRDEAERISIVPLLNRYPQGDPTILARSVSKMKLPVGALPTTIGRVFVDPVACWALGRHLRTGEMFADRPVQLFVEGRMPRLVIGRLGETVAAFLKRHGESADNCQVISNGMLTGEEVALATAAVGPRTESISVRLPTAAEPPTPCIACGWCVDVCPTQLTPVHLMQLAERLPSGVELMQGHARLAPEAVKTLLRSSDARESLHCIACGLCSYVCPTRLPLMEKTVDLRRRVEAAGK